MNNLKQILYRVRVKREEKNYTQIYMAEMLGVSLKTYSNIENELSDLSIKQLIKISEVLDTTIYEFLGNNSYYNYDNCNNSGHQSEYHISDKGYDEAIKSKNEMIEHLKKEVLYFKELIKL